MPDSWHDSFLEPSIGGKSLPQTPALDFLRRVEVWQQAPGGTAGIAVAMPRGDDLTLHQLLDAFRHQVLPAQRLETEARTWLIGYREMQPPLTPSQAAQLDSVIDGLPGTDEVIRKAAKRIYRGTVLVPVVIGLALAGIFGGSAIWNATHPDNSVVQGQQSQPYAPPQQVPPGSTDLQNFQSDWGPWHQIEVSGTNPQTWAPRMLLLNQGGYYASQNWTMPAGAKAWTADLGGNVQSVDVQGHHADITDADGNPWTVGIDQPFVFAANPGTVLKIDPIGTVLSTTTAHAIAIRTHL